MFSTIDARNARSLKISVHEEDQWIVLLPSGRLEKLVSEFVSLPDEKSKKKILDEILQSRFFLNRQEEAGLVVSNEEWMLSQPLQKALLIELVYEKYQFESKTKIIEKKEIWREQVRYEYHEGI